MNRTPLTRSRKSKILSQLFTGEPALLKHLTPANRRNRLPPYEDLSKLTDDELNQRIEEVQRRMGLFESSVTTLTNEQLNQIIAKGRVNKVAEEMTDDELTQSIAFLEARFENEKRSHEARSTHTQSES